MKKLYTLSLLALGLSSYAQVTLPHYDAFNYTVGAALQTQTGWALINSGDDLAITAGNLNYTGLQASTGNKVSFAGSGIDAYKEFTTQTANTVYYSLLVNVNDLAATSGTAGGYSAGFTQATSTTLFGATLWVKKVDETTFNFGINPRSTAANTVFATPNYNVNQTYLVVVSYTFNESTGDDVVNLWINPTIGGSQPASTVSVTNTGGTDLSSVGRFLIRQGSATDTPGMDYDELRVGTTWASVTPQNTAGVGENQIAGLRVYPNPVTNGTLFISTDANAEKSVAIFDVLGKQVVKTKATESVNVSNLNAGVYIVKITEEGKTATRKLVIK